jgi:hypothetical protein
MAAPNLPVIGGGTLGRLTKWSGFTSGNSVIGNSTIFEDKYGMVGIGTDSPTSRLSVAGVIQSLSGGFKFPDGTVQTTAGVAPGQLVVNHDGTLAGDGSLASPLRVSVPLILSGSVPGNPVISATNLGVAPGLYGRGGAEGAESSAGVVGEGSFNNSGVGGVGVFALGGQSNSGFGGAGVRGWGGNSDSFLAGEGVVAKGGDSNSGFGGDGLSARGGSSGSSNPGDGVEAIGGRSTGNNPGGSGVDATGGQSDNGFGGFGIMARGGMGPMGEGLAGFFDGDVSVTGMLSKGGGSFKIDHPIDPENRYLSHSFVESPDMMNVYNGNVVTGENGEAEVTLPDYFEALNRDFRYQLTVIGTFAQAIVGEEIAGNRFKIRTSAPGVKVSWQVTGIRRDPFANKHRIKVEEVKPERERGYYLHPEALGQPEEKSVEWARQPELMQEMMQRRLEAEQMRKARKEQ